MTQPPNDWSHLSDAWTDGAADAPPLDAAFIRRLRWRDRLARWNFIAEIAGGLVVVAIVGWATAARGLPWPMLAAALGFAAFALAMTVWSRRGDPGLLLDTPEAALQSAIAQARSGLRWAWAGLAISLAAGLFLAVTLAVSPGGVGGSPGLLTVMLGFLLACVGFYLNHARRCRRRMAAHEQALAALRAAGV